MRNWECNGNKIKSNIKTSYFRLNSNYGVLDSTNQIMLIKTWGGEYISVPDRSWYYKSDCGDSH